MKAIVKSACSIAVVMFILAAPVFAESEYVDGWLGTWTVTMTDRSVSTWEITDTWVSDSGMSHLAYGVTTPGDTEFIIVYNGMFSVYLYIEQPYGTTVYDLPQDFAQYTELVPADDFQTFTAKPGLYPIRSGYKGTDAPGPEPCLAAYLLGDEDPRLASLRHFRDTVLAESAAGKTIIRIYYEAGEGVIAACEQDPAIRQTLRRMLGSLVQTVQLFYCEN